ncbi:MAG: lipid-binding SYLF domain-containing protein [Candidatus Tectomicrobia bacterium]|uniref:Lipid-binding SYLF domain-containing protein n=1 Tax=Tectimicrobiota bacterium TaxID=2528274 RepID=A0A933GN39_UNCTE|nr:lipid-binding SYLF domain-containing protein [Candidatus Tectomicrobia bacterium]
MIPKREKGSNIRVALLLALLVAGLLFVSYTSAMAETKQEVQRLVDRARVSFNDFMRDPNYSWLHENLSHAKGVLIFPQVLKGGFIFGGSGGTGVLLIRDESTGDWSQPAFYTVGSLSFGLQIGGEAAEVIMTAMTQKAVDSLLASSVKLGGDASVALGPFGLGTKADITADFISFAKSRGIYIGLNLEGSMVDVRESMNKAYYGRKIKPADIIMKNEVSNPGSAELRSTLKRAARHLGSGV